MALAVRPTQVFTPMAAEAIRRAPGRSPAPRWWVITTEEPMPMKLKRTMQRKKTCPATCSAATAPSETWLTMRVSTVMMEMRRPCSTKIGQARARSPRRRGGGAGSGAVMERGRGRPGASAPDGTGPLGPWGGAGRYSTILGSRVRASCTRSAG